MKTLMRRGDVRLLLAGQSLSMFGDWMMIIVLGIWMKVLTQSNGAAGLVFFVFAAASLAAPLGGLLVDRLPKRPIMIATHVALAAVMCSLLFVHDRRDVWLLYVVTALYGLGGDIFGSARGAMLKSMLPDELLADANGAFQSLREGLRLVAPLAGAALFAVTSGRVVALVDAASFLLSAATLVALRFAEPACAPHEHHFLREVSAGMRHIWNERVLRQLTIGVGALLLVIGFDETLIFAITAALGKSPSYVGVVGTMQGIGSVVGGVTAARVLRRLGDLRTAGLGIMLLTVGEGVWLILSLPAVLAGMAVAGVGIVWAVVAIGTSYQRRSSQEIQGRVSAAANMLFSVPQTISIAAGAALITIVDYRVEILAILVGSVLSALYLLSREPESHLDPALA